MKLKHEWAVFLAGGDGTRLKSLSRRITGDERPKPFCRVMGELTLVEETQQRVALELAKNGLCFCRYHPGDCHGEAHCDAYAYL